MKQEKTEHQKCDWSTIVKEHNKKYENLEENYNAQKLMLCNKDEEIKNPMVKISLLEKKMKKQYPEYIEFSEDESG